MMIRAAAQRVRRQEYKAPPLPPGRGLVRIAWCDPGFPRAPLPVIPSSSSPPARGERTEDPADPIEIPDRIQVPPPATTESLSVLISPTLHDAYII
ncbi:hypothetical protein EJB05_16730 [Eragrostis curvula]|uniref:Uncharacterized protein n=1 Tax=Eragrostis curvula TaxID=38414 RepID=A0A5J9VFY8_9POAL|nr:hypothetical protein EJB05_16730 [Eragrostis curvula]